MCRHYKDGLTETDRHYLNAPEHNNCVLCVVDHNGPMTQEEIGKFFGITKERTNQIEKEALRKLLKLIPLSVLKEIAPEGWNDEKGTTQSG